MIKSLIIAGLGMDDPYTTEGPQSPSHATAGLHHHQSTREVNPFISPRSVMWPLIPITICNMGVVISYFFPHQPYKWLSPSSFHLQFMQYGCGYPHQSHHVGSEHDCPTTANARSHTHAPPACLHVARGRQGS